MYYLKHNIVISCAGDNELAEAVNQFLTGKFPKVKTSINNDEIYLESSDQLPSSSEVKAALDTFISTVPTFQEYIINNTGNVFVLAVPVNAEDIGLYNCSWFGTVIKSKGQLEIHEKMHGTIGTGGGIGV